MQRLSQRLRLGRLRFDLVGRLRRLRWLRWLWRLLGVALLNSLSAFASTQ